jgi:carboxylate-amine ligase
MVTSLPVPAADHAVTAQDHLTLRVAEEFLLVDPTTGLNVPLAERVLGALPGDVRERSRPGPTAGTVEMVTSVCADPSQLRGQLARYRRMAGAAAATAGARLVAVGAPPVDDPHRSLPDRPRVELDQALCGCHVHVGVAHRELAVRVCNRLWVWLPVIQALTANSPFRAGADTRHTSSRSMQLARRPGAGPTRSFESAADYGATVAALISSGLMIDDETVHWYARPSASYPAVEVRVGDVCPTADDTVLVAALIRALVATMIDDDRAGVPIEDVRDCVLSAAHWRAAHDGLDGALLDLRLGGVLRPAWELVGELLATVSPALLHHGDIELVVTQLARLRRQGTGAARQRRVYGRTGDINAVVADLGRQTIQQ